MLRVLVIIPCYNEEKNIVPLLQKLNLVQATNYSLQLLLINDASTDSTKDVLESIGVSYLDNSVNLGIGGTVQLGLMFAQQNHFDYALQLDGDGQHRPEDIPIILQPLVNNEADMVIGSRFLQDRGYKSSTARRVGIRLFSWLNRIITGVIILDSTSGFRGFNRQAIDYLVKYYPDEYPEPEVIAYLASKHLRIAEVPVVMQPRNAGKSSIRPLHSFYYMWKVLVNILLLRIRLKYE